MTPQEIDCASAPTFLLLDIEVSKKFEDLRHQLEAETGVNIYYYHCIKSIAANRTKRVRTKRLLSKH
jgi:predicted  nucleic acid-binding Zn ribbon protein